MERNLMQHARRFAMMLTAATALAVTGCAAQQPIPLRDDTAITKDVEDRLGTDPIAKQAKVAVTTKAGVVHLSGNVKTDAERASVEKVARDTPGVRGVDNNVRFGGI